MKLDTITQKYIDKSRMAAASLFCVLLAAVLLAFLLMPDKSFSAYEKRALAQFPGLTLSSILDGSFESGLETYLQDQFPLRNLFVGIGSYFDAATGRNGVDGVYHRDGYFIDEPITYDAANLDSNLCILNDFAQSSGLKSYMMIVPSVGSVLNNRLPRVHKTYHDKAILDHIDSITTGNFTAVDLYGIFKQNAEKTQIFYKTDHHWTINGAYLAYTGFMDAAGLDPIPAKCFSVHTVNNFYGTTYAKAALWLAKSDTMALWRIDGSRFSVEIADAGKQPVASDSLFFESHLSENDMYPAYLDGNHGLTVIANDNASGGSLLILKDSYGNSLTTLLANSYRTIVMVDLRHFRTGAVSSLVSQYGIDSLLVVYGLDNIVNDTNLVWLR